MDLLFFATEEWSAATLCKTAKSTDWKDHFHQARSNHILFPEFIVYPRNLTYRENRPE